VQGFDDFFKDADDWVRNDRLVVGVQLRLVGRPEVAPHDQAIHCTSTHVSYLMHLILCPLGPVSLDYATHV
jgi:hypothetical protein